MLQYLSENLCFSTYHLHCRINMKLPNCSNLTCLLLIGTCLWGLPNDLLASPTRAMGAKRMDLQEAVALALRHNKTVESAYLDRVVEKFNLKIAQDEFRPDFTLSASALYSHVKDADLLARQIGAEISLKIPTGGQFNLSLEHDDSNQSEDRYHSNLKLSFTQPLLKGAGVDVNLASQVIAERQEQSNLLKLQSVLIALITEVINNYRDFFITQRQMEITRLSLERARQLLEVNRALLKAGRLAQVELIQAEADIANQELSVRMAENSLETTRVSFLKTLNIDRNLLVEPVASIDVQPPSNLDLEELQTLAFHHSPEYLQALLAQENVKTQLLLAENNQLWQLDIATQYNLTGASDSWIQAQQRAGQLGQGEYSVGLSLRIPFGDLSTKGELLAAKIAVRQSDINLQQLKEDLTVEIQEAVRNIQMKWEEIKLAQRARELAQQQLDVELEKLKVNRSSNFDVVRIKDSLMSTQNQEINSQIDYLNALTNLDALLGLTLQKWGVDINNVRK